MALDLITRAVALIAVLGSAVVYGTDVFCAIVLRPALASVDDSALVAVTGSLHRYGDRRLPVPGVLGIVATATTAALGAVAAHWAQAIAAAADAGHPLPKARVLQAQWDRAIGARATLQGLALAALCVALAI
ncbi:MAG TPA: DUF1772 domain-containing protein [Mycobacterium sp.]